MNTFISVIGQASLVHHDYLAHVEIVQHQLDRKQELSIGAIASHRLSYFVAMWKEAYPKMRSYGFTYIPLALSTFICIGRSTAKFYCRKHQKDLDNPGLKFANFVLKATDMATVFLNDHLNDLLNIAFAVSYVAMIALGHALVGIIGLVGMGLVVLKETGQLPELVDSYLHDMMFLTSLVLIYFTPLGIFTTLHEIENLTVHISHFIDRHNPLKAYLPDWFSHPFKNLHQKDENKTIEKYSLEKIKELSSSDDNFKINISSIYSNALNKLMPNALNQSISEKEPKTLWDALSAKLTEKNIELSDSRDGFEKIRKGFVEGIFPDHAPPNKENFITYLKGLCQLLVDEEDDVKFSQGVKDLANVGNECVTGWTKEILAQFHPDSDDPEWAVHHFLGEVRSELVKEKIREINIKIKNDPHWAAMDFDQFIGGANNIHGTNALQSLFWHRFRTLDGDVNHNIFGTDILDKWAARWFAKQKDRSFGVREGLFLVHRFFELHPSLLPLVPFFFPHIQSIEKSYSADFVVNAVKNASNFDERRISWDAILEWQKTMKKKASGLKFYCESTNSWDPKWVTKDDFNRDTLTDSGVRLLLWDLGIITPTQSA